MAKLAILEERQGNQCTVMDLKESVMKVYESLNSFEAHSKSSDAIHDTQTMYRQFVELQSEFQIEKEKNKLQTQQLHDLINDQKHTISMHTDHIQQLQSNISNAEKQISALFETNTEQQKQIGLQTASITELKKQQSNTLLLTQVHTAGVTKLEKQQSSMNKLTTVHTERITELQMRQSGLNQLSQVQEKQQSVLTNLTATTQHILAQSQCKRPQVAFSAALSIAKDIHTGNTVIFDDVETNIGDAYDKTTGVFESPVSGLYILFVTASSRGKAMFRLNMYRDSTIIYHTLYSSGLNHNTVSKNIILYLTKGTTIRIKSENTSHLWTDNNQSWTTFSGHLISQQTDECVI